MDYLRKPERALDVKGMIQKANDLGRTLDVDIALEYLRSSEPRTSVDAVVKTMESTGRQCTRRGFIEYLKSCGFKVAVQASSNDVDASDSPNDVAAVIRCQKNSGLHHDLNVISTELDRFRRKIDIEAILKQLVASKEDCLHAMLLPTIMYNCLKVSSERHLSDLYTDIGDLESTLRHVKVRREAASGRGLVEGQEIPDDALDYQYLSRWLNSSKKDQASRDGRHRFRRQFQTCLEKAVAHVKDFTARIPNDALALERRAQIIKAGHQLERGISFNTRIFEFEEGRDVNHRVRIEAQIFLVSLTPSRLFRVEPANMSDPYSFTV